MPVEPRYQAGRRQAARLLTRSLIAACASAFLAGACLADDAPSTPSLVLHTPAAVRIGVERVKLPDDERMGLVGISYLLEPVRGLRIGPAVYGAATGHRGGLFVVGGEAGWESRLIGPLGAGVGLFAGGGGGAAAPVGSGLMLRPHADLWWDFGGWRLGAQAAQVRFPSGAISSPTWSLTLTFDGDFSHRAAASTAFGPQGPGVASADGVGFERLYAVAGFYRPRSGSLGTNGAPLNSRIGFVGVRGEHRFSPHWSWGLESAGAASGGAAGYAEVLGGVGWHLGDRDGPAPLGSFDIGARAALGLAGGGGLPTGGGVLAKAGVDAEWRMTRSLALGVEAGYARATQGDFRATYAQAQLRWDLQAPTTYEPEPPAHQEWVASLADIRDAARRVGPPRGLQVVGFAFNRYLDEHWYLSGQVQSAYGGGAGALSIGLFGIGAQWPVGGGPFSLGGELLAGAAGGGGLDTAGGAIVQPMLIARYAFTSSLAAQVGIGRVRSRHGELSSDELSVGLVYAFGVSPSLPRP